MSRRRGPRCSPRAAAPRRSAASTPAAFRRASRQKSRTSADAVEGRRRSQAAQVRQPVAPIRARRRRTGVCRRWHPARLRRRCDRWGCVVGTGMMGVTYDELAEVQHDAAPGGELDPTRLLDDAEAARPAGVLPQPVVGRPCAADARVRHARLRDARCIPRAPPADRRSARRCKLIRRGGADRVLAGGFDSMINPVGLAGFCLLSAVSADNDTPERRAVRSMPRATASCSAKARDSSSSRNGSRRGGAARASTPSWPATAIRCRSYRITDSHPSGDGPIQAMRAGDRRRRCRAGRRGLPERARHVDADERPQRVRGPAGGVRRTRRQRRGQLDQERDGPPDRRRRRGRGRRLRAGDPARHAAGQCQSARPRSRTATSTSCVARRASARVRVALSNSLGFGGSNSCLAFRHPDDTDALIGDAALNRDRMAAPRIVITGTGAICGAGRTPAEILDARSMRALGGRADRAVGCEPLAGSHRGRGARLQRRRTGRRPQAAEVHPPHRRVRLVRRGPCDRGSAGSTRGARRSTADAAARFADADRRLRRLRRRERSPISTTTSR